MPDNPRQIQVSSDLAYAILAGINEQIEAVMQAGMISESWEIGMRKRPRERMRVFFVCEVTPAHRPTAQCCEASRERE